MGLSSRTACQPSFCGHCGAGAPLMLVDCENAQRSFAVYSSLYTGVWPGIVQLCQCQLLASECRGGCVFPLTCNTQPWEPKHPTSDYHMCVSGAAVTCNMCQQIATTNIWQGQKHVWGCCGHSLKKTDVGDLLLDFVTCTMPILQAQTWLSVSSAPDQHTNNSWRR